MERVSCPDAYFGQTLSHLQRMLANSPELSVLRALVVAGHTSSLLT